MKKFLSLGLIALVVTLMVTGVEAAGPRYVGQGDGTVKDTTTGLFWLRDANCFGSQIPWQEAVDKAAGIKSGDCGLADGSKAGDWRLPTKAEWEAMPKDSCSFSFWAQFSSFDNLQAADYWSATEVDTENAWALVLCGGLSTFFSDPKHNRGYVWPVRGGQ